MVHVCAEPVLAELGAAHPHSHVKAVPVGKVEGVDSLKTDPVALGGFGGCRNASLKSKERKELY